MSGLDTLLQQAEGERDRALAARQRTAEYARRVQAQTDQLVAYRAEYRQRWAGRFSDTGAIEIVHCYQSFMQRLDEALAQQEQQSAAAAAQSARLQQQLLAAELRVASVRKLMQRRQAELQRTHDRREQRQTDETAQQLHWRARDGAPTTSH